MFQNKLLPGILNSGSIPSSPCVSCIEAKSTQISFGSSDTVYSAAFDLVHTDLWGPSPVPSRMGYRYFALFIDHATRYSWVFFLKQKSDLKNIALEFIQMVRTQFGKTVKIIRLDSGGEFNSTSLLDFYKKNGILSQQSCPGVSQQNGIVERKHRHVLDLTRALLVHSKVPPGFWVEVVHSVIYLINRQVTHVLNGISPFYALFGKQPDYSWLKVFGCTCYVFLPTKERHKLDPKVAKCVFVGYSDRHKGYLCYDIISRRLRISCHVVFLEHVLHYKDSKEISSATFDFLASLPLALILNMAATSSQDVSPTSTLSTSTMSSSTNEDNSPTVSSMSSMLHDSSPDTLVESSSSDTVDDVGRRRSTRTNFGHPPSHLNDFVAFSTDPASIPIPTSYKQACGHPHWDTAMKEELSALEAQNTWTLVPHPTNQSVVRSRWVFTVKLKSDGSLDRYKARVVAQGFRQKFGIDYDETFAPVAKMQTVRTLLAVAASQKWPLTQLDVKNAFLHGDLKETIYMECPPGYTLGDSSTVCLLNRSLYGLKQAPRAWFEKFHNTILQAGFVQSANDSSLFTRTTVHGLTALLIYVDDMIITGSDSDGIRELTKVLHHAFQLKELGNLAYFLGLEIQRSDHGLFVCQHKYILDLLREAQFANYKPALTPMEQHLKLRSSSGDSLTAYESTMYRSLVGSLIYLTSTRHDISYAVQIVSQFMSSPRKLHLNAVHRILRYLKGTPQVGIFFPSSCSLSLTAFADADYAGCLDTRRSTSGWCVKLGSSVISWHCKKQDRVAKSSTEAEYRSMSEVSSELVWLHRLLVELGVYCHVPVQLYADNMSAIHITTNPVLHERTKHIEVHVHYIRQLVSDGWLQLRYLTTEEQPADILTKAVCTSRHWFLAYKLMLRQAPSV
ncbi:Retrovirus-related Pol polyprotein from transposon TNT 1-94 [Linum grandiflorum]